MSESWFRKMGTFLLAFGVLAVAVGAVGLPLLSTEGRKGLLIAVGIAFGVQIVSVAVLASLRAGSSAYLVARVVAGMVRFGVVAFVAFALEGRDDVNLTVALLALAGLLFVLLVAEPWMLRDTESGTVNG